MIECVFLAGAFWLKGFLFNSDEFLIRVDRIQMVSPDYDGLTKTGGTTIKLVGENVSVQDSVGEVMTALADCAESVVEQ